MAEKVLLAVVDGHMELNFNTFVPLILPCSSKLFRMQNQDAALNFNALQDLSNNPQKGKIHKP